MSYQVIRGNALSLPLADESVDLIVTSPPYFALRSYRDSGEHYDGQIGSEPHPQQFLEALWAFMREAWRVLKPEGSCFVNLGDKRSNTGGGNGQGGLLGTRGKTSILAGRAHTAEREWVDNRTMPRNNTKQTSGFVRPKSRMGLPERFLIGCMDGLADPGIGWIHRQTIIWEKPNGLPESVTDRTRDNFEAVYHFTKSERYFAAMDEIRKPSSGYSRPNGAVRSTPVGQRPRAMADITNPLGALPGSVWRIASEPLRIPDWAREKYKLPDHFAAFPSELPRRLILAFTPSGICTACDEPRRPMVGTRCEECGALRPNNAKKCPGCGHVRDWKTGRVMEEGMGASDWSTAGHGVPRHPGNHQNKSESVGFACRCPDTSASTRKAVVLDPFGGTGTTAMVAHALGRHGISVDLSGDYCRLAQWRIAHSGHGAKAEQRTWGEAQGSLL